MQNQLTKEKPALIIKKKAKGVKFMFAMFEKDYIMRMIKEAVRMLLKLLFNIDTTVPIEEIIARAEEKEITQRLLTMAEEGRINEAENELMELVSDGDRRFLKTALVFYYRLAEMDGEFLLSNNYTETEIKEGTENIIDIYGLKDLSDLFMEM